MKNKYELNISNQYIHIKFYKEILNISSNQIAIKTNELIIKITGENLMINKLDDTILIEIITKEMQISSIYDIQKLNNKHRDYILDKLVRIKGTTASQISRVTGISINVIQKIKNKINRKE